LLNRSEQGNHVTLRGSPLPTIPLPTIPLPPIPLPPIPLPTIPLPPIPLPPIPLPPIPLPSIPLPSIPLRDGQASIRANALRMALMVAAQADSLSRAFKVRLKGSARTGPS
jgi:hypothetical protein